MVLKKHNILLIGAGLGLAIKAAQEIAQDKVHHGVIIVQAPEDIKEHLNEFTEPIPIAFVNPYKEEYRDTDITSKATSPIDAIINNKKKFNKRGKR